MTLPAGHDTHSNSLLAALRRTAIGPLDFDPSIVVSPFGEAVAVDGQFFVRGTCLEQGPEGLLSCEGPKSVLLRLNWSDWYVVQKARGPMRILRAQAFGLPPWGRVIDASGPDTWISAYIPLDCSERIWIAEYFCGGFMGWSQASFVLRHCDVPASVRWCIDNDPQCTPSQQVLHPEATAVQDEHSLASALLCPTRPLLLQADVRQKWWRGVLVSDPAQIAVVSAPCPPWSRAGSESGLSSKEGELLLQQAAFHGRLHTPVVVVAQVSGFACHQHFGVVQQAWRQAGFEVVCQGCLNLDQVLPVSRSRFLQVWRHRTVKDSSGPLPLHGLWSISSIC